MERTPVLPLRGQHRLPGPRETQGADPDSGLPRLLSNQAGLAVSHRSFCWLRGVARSRGQAHRVLPPPGGGQERVSASPPPDGLLTRFIIKRGWALTHHKATHPVTMTTYIKTGFTGPGLQVKKLSSEVTKQCF